MAHSNACNFDLFFLHDSDLKTNKFSRGGQSVWPEKQNIIGTCGLNVIIKSNVCMHDQPMSRGCIVHR